MHASTSSCLPYTAQIFRLEYAHKTRQYALSSYSSTAFQVQRCITRCVVSVAWLLVRSSSPCRRCAVSCMLCARYAIENKEAKSEQDEADIKRLYKQFGMWHGISSLNNLAVLAAAVAYGWILAGRLSL